MGQAEVEDTGPLTQKRMETVDREFLNATTDFINRANRDNKPFFVWFNTSRMHIWTHLTPDAIGKTGVGVYPDGMVEHDGQVGQLLKQLDDLRIADNTIVIYTTDNGAEVMSWPDGGTTPFRGEKNTNWEGGYRVPAMVRWPGLVKPGTEINDVFSAEDWMQTLLAAVGEPDLKAKLQQGSHVRRQDLQGPSRRLRPAQSAGNGSGGARKEFFYWTDDGGLAGLRYGKWKLVFMEQRAHGFDVWQDPMVTLRVPKLFDLRADPFERGDHEGMGYARWRIDRIFLLVPAQVFVKPLHPELGRVPAASAAGIVQPGGRARQADPTARGGELASRSQCLRHRGGCRSCSTEDP